MGCSSANRVFIENPSPDDRVFCGNHRNFVFLFPKRKPETDQYVEEIEKAGKSLAVSFFIQVTNSDNELEQGWNKVFDPKKLRARITVQEESGQPLVSLGEQFKVNDVIEFRGMSWKILNMGIDGIEIKEKGERYEICRYGFVYVKELEYQPSQKSNK